MKNERTIDKLSLSAGQIDVVIDFSREVHNFKDHKTSGLSIYGTKDYSIESLHDPIENNLFRAKDIFLCNMEYPKGILLEKYAKDWIRDSSRNINVFASSDFLEQLCITHSILRIQNNNNGLDPYNKYLKDIQKEDRSIIDSFMRILDPKILKVAKKFNSKYPFINYSDVWAKANEIVSLLLIGENKKHIEDILKNLENQPNEKAKLRSEFRKHSVHTIEKTKRSNKTTLYLKTILELANVSNEKLATTNTDLSNFLLNERLNSDNFSSFVAESLNNNSLKIYKPVFSKNLKDFIFGEKKEFILLLNYLKDFFRNEIQKNRKGLLVTNMDDFSNFTDENFNYNYFIKPKKWKSNQNNFTEIEVREIKTEAKKILKGKKLSAYLNWLNNAYDSKNVAERQNLHKAKNIIEKFKIDIPIPKSQNK